VQSQWQQLRLRRAALAITALSLAAMGACDGPEQKPKVAAQTFEFVSAAAAQQTDLVIEGKDPDSRRYAEQTLVTLREHLSAAQKLLHATPASR
jgi:hypothetical protein